MRVLFTKAGLILSLLLAIAGCSSSDSPKDSKKTQAYFEERISFYTKLLAQAPAIVKDHYYEMLEDTYEEMGNMDKAKEFKQKSFDALKASNSVDFSPDDIKTFSHNALAVCDDFLIDHPDADFAYMEKYHLNISLLDYNEALSAVTEAISINPQNSEAYITRSALYEKLGQPAKAKQDEKMAIEIGMKAHQ